MNTRNNKRYDRPRLSPAKAIAFSSLMTALGVSILFIGSVIDTLDMSSAAIASLLICVCVIESGNKLAFSVYLATALLAFLILPVKTAPFVYLIFFGYYPLLKRLFEKLPSFLSFALKFISFNIAIFLFIFAAKELLFPDIEKVHFYLILLLNVILFTLDLAQSLFVVAYVKQFRRRLRLDRFFK